MIGGSKTGVLVGVAAAGVVADVCLDLTIHHSMLGVLHYLQSLLGQTN